MTLPHCREAGFALVSAYPIAAQHQVLGVYNLFHREPRDIGSEERHMLDSLGQHLGVAIESLRLVSSERELAIAEERNLLAQELHDSIAQALAFLNLQVQMLRKALSAREADEAARVLEEIQAGVQESYADVRELLVHFRTRTGEGDVEHGIRTMLAKFQHQTGHTGGAARERLDGAAGAGHAAAGDAHPAGGAVQRPQARPGVARRRRARARARLPVRRPRRRPRLRPDGRAGGHRRPRGPAHHARARRADRRRGARCARNRAPAPRSC